MINEAVIAKECVNKTFGRARNVAKNGGFIYNRRCDYEPDCTHLRACMESNSWSDYPYDVSVYVDEDNQEIIDYECTCPAYSRYPGMCKHVAGLLLVYNREPDTFKGYVNQRSMQTSSSIKGLMQRIQVHKKAINTPSKADDAGAIRLDLFLEAHLQGRWQASFKIASPYASYVLKDIEELIRRLRDAEYFEYGKKMGFTHTADMFTAQTQRVLSWLERTTASSTGWWKQYEWQASKSKRYLYLSDAQLIELLDLYLGSVIMFTQDSYSRRGAERLLHVVDEDFPFKINILKLEEGGYQIERVTPVEHVIAFKDRMYILSGDAFHNCNQKLSSCSDFLCNVYEKGEERLIISEEDMPAFCATVLPFLDSTLDVNAPAELAAMKPTPCELKFYLDIAPSGAECRAEATYGDDTYALWDETQLEGRPARDKSVEQAARTAVEHFLPVVSDKSIAFTRTDADMARLLFTGTDELKRYGEVFTTDAFDRRKMQKTPSISTGLSVESKLINMTFTAEDMEPDEIAELLLSYQGKKSYHKLKDGRFIDLQDQYDDPNSELERLAQLAAELGIDPKDIAAGNIELDAFHAFLLDSVSAEEEKDASFKKLVKELSGATERKHEVPEQLKGIMRPYQIEGFDWLNMLCDTSLGGILADEMGLGKSLQTISVLSCHMDEIEEAPVLIVCPASLVYNWAAEFKKFAPSIGTCVLSGTKPERMAMLEEGTWDVLICSYDTLRVDVDVLAKESYSFQVIDEAQYIKNHSTKASKAVKSIKAKHRFALTGTPIENRLSELWSIFDYLMPGMLGPYKQFKERYEAPILSGDVRTSERLKAKIGPFIMRRLKSDVLKDLPDKLETVVHAKLEDEQQLLYEAHETRLRQSLASSSEENVGATKIAILAELTKLRQICCDPRLLFKDYTKHGAKVDTICELIENSIDGGQKVLVFSQFTSFLELIAQELDNRSWPYFTITGATPKKERMKLVEQFNNDKTPVFLISLKAGGTGLNLVGASTVIHADPWWNAAAQDQATDRAHRIGQTQDVNVFKVIADGTIEERILELQEAKSDLADAILSANANSLASMGRDELIELLTSE